MTLCKFTVRLYLYLNIQKWRSVSQIQTGFCHVHSEDSRFPCTENTKGKLKPAESDKGEGDSLPPCPCHWLIGSSVCAGITADGWVCGEDPGVTVETWRSFTSRLAECAPAATTPYAVLCSSARRSAAWASRWGRCSASPTPGSRLTSVQSPSDPPPCSSVRANVMPPPYRMETVRHRNTHCVVTRSQL